MNENAIVMVKNGEYTNTGIARLDNSVTKLASLLVSSRRSDTAIAMQCLEIRESYKEAGSRYSTYKYESVIEELFGNSISGRTAYRRAQCAELFSGIPEVWDFYTISRMEIATRILSKKMVDKGASLADFWYYVGGTDNKRIADNYQKWHDENANTLESIRFNRENGHEDVAKMLEDALKAKGKEPLKPIPYEGNEDEFNEKIREYGYNLTLTTNDANFRKLVCEYCTYIQNDRNDIAPETTTEETTTEETTTEETATEKTLAELKADCINALNSFVEKYGENPKTIERAIAWLEKTEV